MHQKSTKVDREYSIDQNVCAVEKPLNPRNVVKLYGNTAGDDT